MQTSLTCEDSGFKLRAPCKKFPKWSFTNFVNFTLFLKIKDSLVYNYPPINWTIQCKLETGKKKIRHVKRHKKVCVLAEKEIVSQHFHLDRNSCWRRKERTTGVGSIA